MAVAVGSVCDGAFALRRSGGAIGCYGGLSVVVAVGILALHAGREGDGAWGRREHVGMERCAARSSC